jgi:hypothetical protein
MRRKDPGKRDTACRRFAALGMGRGSGNSNSMDIFKDSSRVSMNHAVEIDRLTPAGCVLIRWGAEKRGWEVDHLWVGSVRPCI